MTVQGRDASNFDGSIDHAGLGFLTHKVTEGTSVIHDKFGPRLAAARTAGVPVLGAYHVVRTPGSGGAGSLASQLRFWVAQMDARTPWWRSVPFILQIDAEKWPYDNVAAGTVLGFAALLVGSGLPGYKVTYASRGQYGDSLRGIATDLWNADYRASSGGSYPGDGWTVQHGSPAGWAPFSGKTPVFLQYTSTPHDKDAFRGDLNQLLALVKGSTAHLTGASTVATIDDVLALLTNDIDGGSLNAHNVLHWRLRGIQDQNDALLAQTPFGKPTTPGLVQLAGKLDQVLAALGTLHAGGVDAAALVSQIVAGVIASHDKLTDADEPVIEAAVRTVLHGA
jgi:hypothetical protein